MEFINDTPFAGSLARGGLFYQDLMLATVVLKCTFDVDARGGLRPAAEQPLVCEKDVDNDFGTISAEVVPIKAGCDVAVYGQAHSPQPTPALTVVLKIGEFERRLQVSGDRTWTKSWGSWKLSPPQPFTTMPITYQQAYGGETYENEKVIGPYFDNPFGRGYVVREEHVAATAPPNVEEADQLVTAWTQRPLPAGLALLPRHSALRGRRGVRVEGQQTILEPAFFSCAHPRMTLPRYPAGAKLALEGMHRGGAWNFTLPALDHYVTITLGAASYQFPLTVDTLYLFPEANQVSVVARQALVYQILPERLRSILVSARPATPAPGKATTIAAQLGQKTPVVPIISSFDESGLQVPLDVWRQLNPITDIVEALPLCPSG